MSKECDVCGGDGYYIDDGTQYQCECIYKYQLRYKIDSSGIGAHQGSPPTSIMEAFKDEEKNLFPYLYVKMNGAWPQKKFNSILGYCFVEFAFEASTYYYSMNTLREKYKKNNFVTEFDCDLLAVSYNLDGVFKGIGNDRRWAKDQVRSILQRTIRCRLQNRKPMWFFGYKLSRKFENDVEKMMIDNDFNVLDLNEKI